MTRPRVLTRGARLRLAFDPLCTAGAGRTILLAGPAGRTLLRPVRPLEHHVALTVRAGDHVSVGGPTLREGSVSVTHTHLHLTAPAAPVAHPERRPVPRPGRLAAATVRPAPTRVEGLAPAPGAAPVPRTVTDPAGPGPSLGRVVTPAPSAAAPCRPAAILATPVTRPPAAPVRLHDPGHVTAAPVPRHVARPALPTPHTGGADTAGAASSVHRPAPAATYPAPKSPDRSGAPAPVDVNALTRQVIATIERRQLAERERRGHGPGA